MLRQANLIALLDKAMNQTARIRQGNEAVYFCPFCHHYKKKLEVNVDTEWWHCWVCHASGKLIRTLFRKLQVNRSFYTELYKITGNKPHATHVEETHQILSLPKEFIPFSTPVKSFEYNNALGYVKRRGITREDILRYNIGYCEDGEYKNRVVIPSYDANGNVNFFSARDIYENPYKYRLPPWSKDIIGFELFINWDEPITLVEGGFDAIAIRRNAIPLFGTTMSNKLKEAIIENGVWRVNIVLDNDALKNAIKISEFIEKLKVQEIDVYLTRLNDKDPSKLGFEKVNEIIESQAKPLDWSELTKLKLNL